MEGCRSGSHRGSRCAKTHQPHGVKVRQTCAAHGTPAASWPSHRLQLSSRARFARTSLRTGVRPADPRIRLRQNCHQDAIKPRGLAMLIADHHRKHRHCCTSALELHLTDCRHRHPTRKGRVRLVIEQNWPARGLGVRFDPGGQVTVSPMQVSVVRAFSIRFGGAITTTARLAAVVGRPADWLRDCRGNRACRVLRRCGGGCCRWWSHGNRN